MILRLLQRLTLLALLTGALASAQPVRLAAPGFGAVNFDEAIAAFYSEHFAQQLSLRNLSVVTAAEITALLGLERQRQLLGCDADASSCLAELSGALGVDAIITGSVGKVGRTLQANIKIIRATDGSPLSLLSRTASSEDELFDALTEAAGVGARDVLARLRPGTQAALDAERAGLGAASYRVKRANIVSLDVLSMILGIYALEYERVFFPHLSLSVRPALLALHLDVATRGAELGLGGRIYPLGRAPHGLWFGPEVRSSYGTGTHGTGLAFAITGAVGWNWVSESFPVAGSVEAAFGSYLTAYDPLDLNFDGRLTAKVGFPF